MNVFFTADLHLGHDNICKFKREDDSPLRPWDDVNEMNEALVKNYNEIVRPGDTVYFLGDIAMNEKGLEHVARLNGNKELILGNHDNLRFLQHFDLFRRISSQKKKYDFMMSHVPMHHDSFNQFTANVHGHLHYRSVLLKNGQPDPRYLCVSVEHTEYRPLSLEEVQKRIQLQNSR